MASSTRRQSSSTSLSKYARAHSPDFADHSLDFCNAFWGLGDVGVDVIFARLRGATRTTEELKNFWKERYVSDYHRAETVVPMCSPGHLLRSNMQSGWPRWQKPLLEGMRLGGSIASPT